MSKIKLGDKEYSQEDLESIVNQHGEGTRALQALAKFKQAAAKYDLSPEEFVQQSEGSFAVISELMDQGIVDNKGNIKNPGTGAGRGEEDDFLTTLLNDRKAAGEKEKPGMGSGKLEAIVAALQEQGSVVKSLAEQVTGLQRDNAALLRVNLKSTITNAFPDLKEDKDLNLVISRAHADQSKDLMAHAKDLLEERKGFVQQGMKELAEQLGIEDVDAKLAEINERKQQSAAGGGAVGLFKGKKFSFNPKDENSVHPMDAAAEHLEKSLSE